MPLVQVWLDESGKLADTANVAFGGCVMYQTGGAFLSECWGNLLNKAGIGSVHMKDAMGLRGEFRHWSAEPRDKLLLELAALVRRVRPQLVSAAVTKEQFLAIPQKSRGPARDAVYYGFEGCIRTILGQLPEDGSHKVQIACDLSEAYSLGIVKLFHKLRYLSPKAKQLCYALSFADDQVVPLVQVADMFAYCCREMTQEPRPVIAKIYQELTGKDRLEASATLVYSEGCLDPGSGTVYR